MNTLKKTLRRKNGFTLVELITVLTILSVMAAFVVPSLVGFIDKVKEEQYVLEAQEVRRSIDLYLIVHNNEDIDSMTLLLRLTSAELDSPDHPLAGYMTVRCTKGASIEGLTLDKDSLTVSGMVYRAAGYRIELDENGVSVARERKA